MSTPHDWDDDLEFEDDMLADAPAESPLELPEDDSAQQLALTPDGSVLTLTGPGAGTAVRPAATNASSQQQAVATRIATRDEALDGQSPLLLVHWAYGKGQLLPRALGGIIAATGGQTRLGAIAPLPRSTSAGNTAWLASCAGASVRIADPMGFKLDSNIIPGKVPSAQALRRWPYLASDPLNVADVLDAQRQVGANLLLSPGRAVDPGNPQPSLDSVFAEADQALSNLQSGERLGLNLTLPRSWLSTAALRNRLLDQLLDQEQFDVWYLRVQWPSALRSTEQPTDDAMLQGYKRLAQLAADEERILLLPQTGLTGWLQLGFGAAGFGSGLPGADQAFKEPVTGGNGAPPIERYFEPTLLHSVERTVHDVLRAGTSYVPCACPYCPALHASPDWRPELAALHHLHWMGRLAADTAPTGRGGPGGAVRRAVRSALNAARSQPLAGLSQPRHLEVWDRLL